MHIAWWSSHYRDKLSLETVSKQRIKICGRRWWHHARTGLCITNKAERSDYRCPSVKLRLRSSCNNFGTTILLLRQSRECKFYLMLYTHVQTLNTWTDFKIRQPLKFNVDQFWIPKFENTVGLEGSHFPQLRESYTNMTKNRNAQSEMVPVLENDTSSDATKEIMETASSVRCYSYTIYSPDGILTEIQILYSAPFPTITAKSSWFLNPTTDPHLRFLLTIA